MVILDTNFRELEAIFMQKLRNEGNKAREYNGGWRIGSLEVRTNPEQSKIQILYNKETLIRWTTVNSLEDFINLIDKANNMLSKSLISEKDMEHIFNEATTEAVKRNENTDVNVIAIWDYYREFRLALIRKYLTANGVAVKIVKYTKFPAWAFLYNLDKFRSVFEKIPVKNRLGMRTGGQKDISKGQYFVVNGLEPDDEYKTISYVEAYEGRFL